MTTFCTLSDCNFLINGIALYESLRQYDNDFRLFYLCLDEKTYETIKNLDQHNLIPIPIETLEREKDLQQLRNNPPSNEAIIAGTRKGIDPKRYQFIWSLASYFSYWVFENYDDSSEIIYLDSDLYFFDNWKKIIETVNNKSIGLVRNNSNNDAVNGQFNVSLVYFKNDLIGNQCLWSWRYWLLNPQNEYANKYGTCGDQLYLELFSQLFGEDNIVILDDKGINQGAPWSTHKINENFLYFHFSDFVPNFQKETYIPGPRHGLNEVQGKIKEVYDEYFNKMREIWKLLNLN